MRTVVVLFLAIISNLSFANEALEFSSGLKVSVCKGFLTPDATCMDLWDGLHPTVIELSYDSKSQAEIGSFVEDSKVGDLNIQGTIAVARFSGEQKPRYIFKLTIISWLSDDPSSISQSTGEIETDNLDALQLMSMSGEVHVFDTWAAMPTLYVGRKGAPQPNLR